jgi:predicted ATPase
MTSALQALGRAGLSFFERLGRSHVFLGYTLLGIPAAQIEQRG